MKAIIYQISLGLCLMSCAGSAWALCRGTQLQSTITEQQIKEIRPARDAPVGSVLHTIRINQGVAKVKCEGGEFFTYGFVQEQTPVRIAGMTHVYETGIAGIGVRIFWPHEGKVFIPSPMKTPQYLNNYEYSPPQDFTLYFIKTGGIQTSVSKNLTVQVRYGGLVTNRLIFSGLYYEPRFRSCLPEQFNQSVEMPPIRARELGGVGGTAGAKPFSIKLSCEADLKVAYRIDSPGQKNNVIQNANEEGMAKGVGVQLFKGDAGSNEVQPLKTRTEVGVSAAPGAPFGVVLPLTARYYQTEPKVTGGKVSATATVTFFYE